MPNHEEFRDMSRDRAAYILDKLCEIVDDTEAGPARVEAARLILEYAYGRPGTTVVAELAG